MFRTKKTNKKQPNKKYSLTPTPTPEYTLLLHNSPSSTYGKGVKSNKIKNHQAFTLVELIVVIVILAILATISFLSFNSYSSNSRDSVRLGDLNNIKKGLELYQVKTATYPIPEGTIYTGTVNGVDVVYKGIIGDNISNIINVSKTPKDPIDTTKNYIYGITYDKTKYQIAITLENSNSTSYYSSDGRSDGVKNDGNSIPHLTPAYRQAGPSNLGEEQESVIARNEAIYSNIFNNTNLNNQLSISLDNAKALSNNSNINNNSRQARVSGMYNGYIKFNSGTNIYLANIPSLIYNSTGSINLLSTGVYYVVNKNSNLPYTISNTDIYNNKSGDIIIQEYTNKTGATLTGVDITSIVNSTDSTTRTNLINSMFSGSLLDSFGGDVGLIMGAVGSNSSSNTNTPVETNGLSSSTPGTSCLSIKTNYPSSTNGYYYIQVGSTNFRTYCDMTNGGWTLVARTLASNNYNNTAAMGTLTTYTQTSGSWKISDADINTLPKTNFKFSCYLESRYATFPSSCVFNSTSIASGTCNPYNDSSNQRYSLTNYPTGTPMVIYYYSSGQGCWTQGTSWGQNGRLRIK